MNKIFCLIKNILSLRLYKAAARKLFSNLIKEDVLGDSAHNFYITKSIKAEDFAVSFGFEIDDSIITTEIKELEKSLNISKKEGVKRTKMGGFADIPFIYSLVKHFKRKSCIECGVSLGGSSFAILSALEFLGNGRLVSNDLPYLWMEKPTSKIGALVPEKMKHRWELHIGDDLDNLPKIVNRLKKIDFAHYDSNKSYKGREFFFATIKESLSEDSIIIFDDIINNDHFYDLCSELEDAWEKYVLLSNEKYIGLVFKHNLLLNYN